MKDGREKSLKYFATLVKSVKILLYYGLNTRGRTLNMSRYITGLPNPYNDPVEPAGVVNANDPAPLPPATLQVPKRVGVTTVDTWQALVTPPFTSY